MYTTNEKLYSEIKTKQKKLYLVSIGFMILVILCAVEAFLFLDSIPIFLLDGEMSEGLISTILFFILCYILMRGYMFKSLFGIITNREIFFMYLCLSVEKGRRYIEFNNKKDINICIKELENGINRLYESIGKPYFSFSFGSRNTQDEIKKLKEILTHLRYTKKALKEAPNKKTFSEIMDNLEILNREVYDQKVLEAHETSEKLMTLSRSILGDKIIPWHIKQIDKITLKLEHYPFLVGYVVLLAFILIVFLFSIWISDSLYNAIIMTVAIIGAIKITYDIMEKFKERFRRG